ncbi:MAG: hypothetical protein R2849_03890 [Thermomicrobiales bacterium]
MEDGRFVKYYDESGAYWVDEYGNETPVSGFQVPTLLYVDGDGDAYFRVFIENEGDYRYYTIDHDGGVEYIHDYDVPGYEEPPYEEEYEYPRVVEWDADEGWVIVQNEDGYYAKIYEDGQAYPVDEYGDPIATNGVGYYYPDLLYVDEYGNAYFRSGDPGNYSYYMIDHDGGVEYVNYEDIPEYEDPQYDDDGYPIVTLWDHEAGWVVVQEDEDHYSKYYTDGNVESVDQHGNALQPNGLAPELGQLLYIEAGGDAYFRSGEPGNYEYYTVDQYGHVEYIHYSDVPGYEPEPGEGEEYEYPRVIEWDADDGWVIIEDENGDYVKYYENRPPHFVDAEGNEIPGNYPNQARLIQVDQYGNSYFQYLEDGEYAYIQVDGDGGIENVDPHDIPGFEYEELDDQYDYPRTVDWDANAGWVIAETDLGYQVKLYENGEAYFVDDYGNETPVGDYPVLVLIQVDEYGTAYLRGGEGPDYTYYTIDHDGGIEYIQYEDIPGYEDLEPPYEDGYPRLLDHYDGEPDWALVEHEDGRIIKYYADGGEYQVGPDGGETPIMTADHLLSVDQYGNVYFQRYDVDGHHQYYTIAEGGGVEYVDPYGIPGYEVPEDYQPYEYPRAIEWDADEGWVTIDDGEGHYVRYYEDGHADLVDQYGNPAAPNGAAVPDTRLVYVDADGNAYFEDYDADGDISGYFMIDYDGGIEAVEPDDIPGYEEPEPPYEDGHPPYFYEDYPNPLYGDLEPDGDPVYANGGYQQTYNDGQVVVTWNQEGGPYEIRYYSEENAGGYLQLHLTYDAYDYGYQTSVYPYDYYDHVEDGFDLQQIDHYVDYAYLGVPYDNMEISNTEVEYYWYDNDGDLVQKTTVNRVTGEVTYQYDDLYIHVDQYGNETYDGNPDPNWMAPEGYGQGEDLYPPYGMPPYLVFGEGYVYEEQYADPEAAGYTLISATPEDDPAQWQYLGPNGERIIVNQLDDNTYQYAYQNDPNAQPGVWEMVINVNVDEYGNYVSDDAVDGTYYDEWYDDALQDEDYEYPRTHLWDTEDNWVVLELTEGQYVRYDEYRPPYLVDEYGNEIAPGFSRRS